MIERFWLGRYFISWIAKRKIRKQTKGVFPAPLRAVSVLERTHLWGMRLGLLYEANVCSRLAIHSISKELIHLFYVSEALKKDNGVKSQVQLLDIQSVGVLGAGLMGGGIAWLMSSKDYFVRIRDIEWPFISKAFFAAYSIYQRRVKRKRLRVHDFLRKWSKISATLSLDTFHHMDLVIEAIPENMALKKKVFMELEEKVSHDAIIATNTSALSVTEMASELRYPNRFVGMHFFSPVHRMPLVEVIGADKTDEKTIATIVSFSKKLGKVPIVVKDSPGFLINRLLLPYVNEAIYLIQDYVPISVIDKTMTQFGMPIGPLMLADEVGLDVGYKVLQILEKAFGQRMAISEIFSILMQESRFRGKKTGEGFYIHKGKKATPNSALMAHLKSTDKKSVSKKEVQKRMLMIMINEATRALEEKVVSCPKYLDMAMILGTGFPVFRGGLLRYADTIGAKVIVDTLQQFSETYGERFLPSSYLIELASQNKCFYNQKRS